MLIAHFPVGYLEGKVFNHYTKVNATQITLASLLGNMIPDFDMLYFHLIDGRKTHHHEYFTHWPLFWMAVSAVLLGAVFVFKRQAILIALAFCIGTILHMVMDSVAAPIHWLAPFSPETFELVHVPATSTSWVISFMTHWTFLIEIGICLLAALVYWRKKTALLPELK